MWRKQRFHCEDVERYVEVVGLMYFKDLKHQLIRAEEGNENDAMTNPGHKIPLEINQL